MHKKTTETTTKELSALLSPMLQKMQKLQHNPPQQILLAWPATVGEKWAPMTKAVSFSEGILKVNVKNSTLRSLLEHEKQRLLKSLKEKFPSCTIQEIRFCMG